VALVEALGQTHLQTYTALQLKEVLVVTLVMVTVVDLQLLVVGLVVVAVELDP
jgi:hypothetical protein